MRQILVRDATDETRKVGSVLEGMPEIYVLEADLMKYADTITDMFSQTKAVHLDKDVFGFTEGRYLHDGTQWTDDDKIDYPSTYDKAVGIKRMAMRKTKYRQLMDSMYVMDDDEFLEAFRKLSKKDKDALIYMMEGGIRSVGGNYTDAELKEIEAVVDRYQQWA